MGELKREIKNWCWKVRYEQADKSELKRKLESILERWRNSKVIRQDIGMVIQGSRDHFDLEIDSEDKVWKLVNEVEPRIKSDYEEWANKMRR